jgi:hypothetical protein
VKEKLFSWLVLCVDLKLNKRAEINLLAGKNYFRRIKVGKMIKRRKEIKLCLKFILLVDV